MKLIEELMEAERHLRAATQLASDWRVREAAANAGTLAACAVLIQEKIGDGKLQSEPRRPKELERSAA
jgi:hypothetical protein